MSAPSNGGAPLGIPLELRDEAAILNFIFSNSSIAFAPPPLPPAPAPAPAPAAPPAAPTDAADRFAADLEAHARWNDREAAAVAAAEDGRQDEARAILDDVCAQAPGRASGFNNRAQLRRLASDAAGAKADLDAAVRLAQAWLAAHEAGGHPLAEFHRGVLRAALTQRAAWWHAAGKPDEEMDDLSAAAAAGSALARMLATKSNPYATMCQAAVNVMLANAMGEGAGAASGAGGHGGAAAGAPCAAPDGAGSSSNAAAAAAPPSTSGSGST